MLLGFDIVTLVIFIPTFYVTGIFGEDLFINIFLIVIFFVFFIIPHIFLYIFQKSKWTEFNSDTKTIHLGERNKIIKSLNFNQIRHTSISEYTYTVKTKNGSRTITVFTVLGHLEAETLQLAESTNFPEIRSFGETITKILKTSIQNESGKLISYSELDLPIHKRILPKEISESEITFQPDSQITITRTNQESLLKSRYQPKIFVFVAITVSFALTLIIHFVIGSVFDLSIESWKFPPSYFQLVFLIVSLSIGFFPLAYVWWNYKKRKEIRITKDSIYWNDTCYVFQKWEEILLKENKLYIVNDLETKTHSLFFFCLPGDYPIVRNWILIEIGKQSGGNEDLGRF
ncbi:hypothetical protein EHQ49_13415 [Leptospira perdikensis]|uniref:Uncharacterized protein n=1 Tax=Leptospira perdikensis TaxID=2484948 RepID=A0A4R9JFR5_9LEPT|nr:hypothetical protein EHQ49_13415 [Leptospira perdikensis]